MPFVKLDCGMLNSTIWYDFDARIVFITALLMAEPREFVEPVQQIDARKIEYTGWSAPPAWYGFVPAAGTGIVKNAGGISMDDGLAALERMGKPDPESRTPDHEGRRMIRVDGGYVILNYDKYRQRDYTAAERQRRFRERKKGGDALRSLHHALPSRNVTQAEVDSRSIEKKSKTSSSPKKTAKELVEEFMIEDKHREWAAKNAPSVPIDEELEAWKDRERANEYTTGKAPGIPVRDASAAFRTAMRNAEKWGTYRNQQQRMPQQSGFVRNEGSS